LTDKICDIQGCCKFGKKQGPGGGSLLAEREVPSLPPNFLPPKAAIRDFAIALL
jgi:hypothetical protein